MGILGNMKWYTCILAINKMNRLEFEKVIVMDASENNYCSKIDTNYLYIACSRAMHELSLYSVGNLTKLIK